MWPLPAFDLLMRAKKGQTYHGRWHSRVRGLPEFDGELPVAALAEEFCTPGEEQLRALVTIAGNPVLSTPNGEKLDAALAEVELMVSVDPYLNATTRRADYILPPAVGLETQHYDVVFHHFAVRNTARISDPIFPIAEDQRYDYQIFEELRRRLSGEAGSTPDERLELGLKHGPRRTSLAELRAAPHGTDYGPMEPCLPRRLLTAEGRINAAPAPMLADLPRLSATLTAPAAELVLIGRRQLRSNNSWMHNVPRLMRGPERCTLMLSPLDAARLGVSSGQRVEVRSRVGAVTAEAEVTDTLMPGVVSLPHGFGHGKAGVKLEVAQAHAGVSLNDLTDPEFLDELTGNTAASGVPVSVRVVQAAQESAAD